MRLTESALKNFLHHKQISTAKPIYEYLAGWTEDISAARKLSDLPKNAQDYVAFLEKISGAPMSAIGVGPGRDQTIVVKEFI
jgi:adenylosuccinate synthase